MKEMKTRTLFALVTAACVAVLFGCVSLAANAQTPPATAAAGAGATAALAVTTPQPAQLPLTWTEPTQNTDGTAYAPGATAGYNLYGAATDAALTAMPNVGAGTCTTPSSATALTSLTCANSISGAATLAYKTVGLPVGQYFFAVTAWSCPSTGGCLESAQSPHVSATVALPVITIAPPKPPGGLTVTATATATATAQ